MNHQFKNYSTQTAFNVSLSAVAINELHQLVAYSSPDSYGMPNKYKKGFRFPEEIAHMERVLSSVVQ